VPAAGAPSRSQRPWSYPSRRLVLSPDALGQVVIPALGAPLDDVAAAEHVLLDGLDEVAGSGAHRQPCLMRLTGARRPARSCQPQPLAKDRGRVVCAVEGLLGGRFDPVHVADPWVVIAEEVVVFRWRSGSDQRCVMRSGSGSPGGQRVASAVVSRPGGPGRLVGDRRQAPGRRLDRRHRPRCPAPPRFTPERSIPPRPRAHDVRIHTTVVKLIHHPVVGDLDLPFESFPMGSTPARASSRTPRTGLPHARRRDPAGQLGRQHRARKPLRRAPERLARAARRAGT
jgi:hypothetical protein